MRTIVIKYHHEDDAWWAESDDLPGYSAAAETLPLLRDRVREGVAFALEDSPDSDADVDLRETMADGSPLLILELHWSVGGLAGHTGSVTPSTAATVDQSLDSIRRPVAPVYYSDRRLEAAG